MTSAHNGPHATTVAGTFRFHAGGRLATVGFEPDDGLPRRQVGGGLRGVIRGFSRQSRRRLMHRIASVNRLAYERPPAFLTLTYPREYPNDPERYRADARAFLKRLRRLYGPVAVVWRLEFQKRGAPHFHMLCFDLEPTQEVEVKLRQAWYEVVKSGDRRHARHGIDLQELRSWRRVTAYLSKYIAKRADDDGEVHEPIGRWWGVEHGESLRVDPVTMLVSFRNALRMRRHLQRYAGMIRRGGQRDRGVSAYLGDDAAARLAMFYDARFRVAPTPS